MDWYDCLLLEIDLESGLLNQALRRVFLNPGYPQETIEEKIRERFPHIYRHHFDQWLKDYFRPHFCPWFPERSSPSYSRFVASQVSMKDWKRLQELDVNLDTATLAGFWPDFVDYYKRSATEVPFLRQFIDTSHFQNPLIFDACLGTGETTIGLGKSGY